MKRSIINPRKKERGRPPVDSEQINSRLPRDLLNALDAFIEEYHPGSGRAEAVRLALREWAEGRGYLRRAK